MPVARPIPRRAVSVLVVPEFVPQLVELNLIRDFEVRCAGEPVTVPPA